MEAYKKLNFKRITVAFGLILLIPVSSCKKLDKEDINTDSKKLEHGPYVAGSYITGMMQNILRSFPESDAQLQQNLNADVYSGYMATASGFNSGVNNTTYFMMNGWNNAAARLPYDYVLNPWLDVKKETFDTEKELYAISLIIKVSAGHRLTDIFGPIPYTQLGKTGAEFDSQETLYKAFFTELKTAIDILTDAENKNDAIDQVKFAPYDVSNFGGDFRSWVRYANTLRLRLAIRIAAIPSVTALAKEQAELSVEHPFGFLESTPFAITVTKHYLGTISGWTDISLNANVESYLNGYGDPRAAKYAKLASAPASIAGKIKGIRNGIDVTLAKYSGHSFLNVSAADKLQLMGPAESFFLRAEGALLYPSWNWKGGNAKAFYEMGITKSFDQYGLGGVSDYIGNSTSKPIDYVDVLNPDNNITAASDVTIKWDDGLPNEKKLEKIITQKWIAGFPEGQEAWTEFRRTGYPKLFPVKKNDSQGEVPLGQFIKRLPYPSYFSSSNAKGVADAVTKYLGADKMSTKLWWDLK